MLSLLRRQNLPARKGTGSGVRKISAKKLKALGGKLPFSTASRTAVKRKPRKASAEHLRGLSLFGRRGTRLCLCVAVDLQHSIRIGRPSIVPGGAALWWGDVRSLTLEEISGSIAAMFAFPPCTNLAVSGARDFQRKGLRLLIDALEVVEACRVLCENSGAAWMIENPVSTLSTYWRKPDYSFDPADYGDGYTKKTCLWTGGGFVMPPKNRVEITAPSYIHKMPPSADRANLRSATPMGFARAVYQANAQSAKAVA